MLIKKSLIAISLLLVFSLKPFAQVTLQTGSAVFSLPMFNWQDDKSRLTSVVALNYSSGNGLKVNDIASNVGQGWNLVAGGVITRLQVGEPDDQPSYAGNPAYNNGNSSAGNGSDQDITKYPAGYLYHKVPSSTGCPNTLTTYPTYSAKNVLYSQKLLTGEDKQQDYFSFQFNGKSGMFILDTTGGDHGIPLGDTKLKISFQRDLTMANSLGIRTTITSFIITDVDGLIYKFTYHGLTKLLSSQFSTKDGTTITKQPTIKNGGVYCQAGFDLGPTNGSGPTPWVNQFMAYPYIISNWYLSEIDDPFTTRKITFTYNTLNLSISAGQDISNNSSTDNYIVISYKKSITTTLEISSINFPDGHVVSFNYAAAQRFDYPGESALSSIAIQYQGRYVSQYQLGTSYFVRTRLGNPTTPYEQGISRLCLRTVKKISVDLKEDSPPYVFDYYTSTGSNNTDDMVPPPFFYVKDIWGYYNGNNSIASNSPISGSTIPVTLTAKTTRDVGFAGLKGLCFQNDNVTGTYYNAKPGFAQNGLLREITYPTGGSLTYTYAQNTGSFIGSSTVMNVGGVHVSQTSSSDGGYSNGCATPVVTQYNYVMNGTGSASSLWGLETPVNSMTSNNYWKEEKMTLHWSFINPFGTCLWHYIYPGIISQYQAVNLETWQKIMNVLSPVLGVLSVISTIDDIVNVIASTGFLTVVAVVIDVISTVFGYIFSCSQLSKPTLNTVFYDFDLNQMAPLPAQFKRVEVTESSGTNGKTVEQFTHGDISTSADPQYYPLWSAPGSNTAFSSKQRFAPWAYGLPYLTTVYDVNGNKIKETQNVYDTTFTRRTVVDPVPGGTLCYSKLLPLAVSSCKCQVVNNYSLRSDRWTNRVPIYITNPNNTDVKADIYNFFTGRMQLKTTYERTYRVTDATQFVQTETDYFYNTADCDLLTSYSSQNNYEVNTIYTKQSNGDANYKYIKYTTDLNNGILSTMIQKNIVSLPISTYSTVYKLGGSSSQYLNEKVTEFTQLSNGDVKPSRILEQRFATPQTSFTAYSGPATSNYASYKIPQQFTYDVNSNLIGVTDEGGRRVSNIYDYNDKYVVASVINADPVLDKPVYTSFENSGFGGWVLTGPGRIYATNSITGSRGFALASNTLSASLNTSKPYVLSFWATTSGVVVTGGATLSKSGPTYSGMTYYEYNIAQGTSSVSLTGISIIDELRLYPATSRMRTTTYDPLIGKTSECDENNRITYYTYDNLARLQFIEDESGNVVKAYEYNTVSAAKQTGCPTTYSNHFISEIFTRSNCSVGYQGDTITYTIPAGRYNSIKSQQDADLQAELDLLTNGQNYANANRGCLPIYYNTTQSVSDTTQSCSPGYKGALVTYTVPANTYNSIISQADANQQALDDISANAQAFANSLIHMSCVVDTTSDWEWFSGDDSTAADPYYCLSVNGQLPPHQFILLKDLNPNSITYNLTKYYDNGPSSACPANTYFNAQQSIGFIKNNCGSGYTGSTVYYTVPPGKYSSTTSQAAADQLATNDENANGQNYANANGTCTQNCSFTAASGFGIATSGMSSSGGTVTFYIVFYSQSGTANWNNSNVVANIIGGCTPSANRTITMTGNGCTWQVIIYTSNMVSVRVISGTAPSGSTTIGLTGGSYPL